MFYLLLAPFVIQGIVMFVDEFYYHHKRGLPKWEILGHPLDSLTVLACFSFLNFTNYSYENMVVFICLASFSCLFVTKDELIHYKLCSAGEMWLHGLLFVLHPLTFTSAAYIWWLREMPSEIPIHEFNLLSSVLKYQSSLVVFFMIYQITYWGVPWKKLLKSTTPFTTL